MGDSRGVAAPDAADDAGRHETEAERVDRNLDELLQELRVTSIGVQVLFGFLLSLPFTTRFAMLDDAQRRLYVVDLTCAAVATAVLIAPVAYHRLMFRQHVKLRLLRTANVLALVGLAIVGLTIAGSVLLVMSFVYEGFAVVLITAFTTVTIFGLWFVLPISARRRDRFSRDQYYDDSVASSSS
jgi:O-antigen/teichoic acid export membrane protein